MQAKCWWPCLWLEQTVSVPECAIAFCLLMRPVAQLCYLFIAIPNSQGMPTNMIEISHLLLIASNVFSTDSVGGYYPAPLALLLIIGTQVAISYLWCINCFTSNSWQANTWTTRFIHPYIYHGPCYGARILKCYLHELCRFPHWGEE